MANNLQNRAYLPHLITDPHCHPILLLQSKIAINFENFINNNFVKSDFLLVLNTPFNAINNQLVNFINNFNFPILMKTSDYHTFVVNNEFLKRLKEELKIDEKDNIWRERNFDLVDKLFLKYLLEKNEVYKLLSEEFLKNDICKVIDAFVNESFLEFYNSLFNSLFFENQNDSFVDIFFLLDSKLVLRRCDVLKDNRVLGVKFFVDGTITSNSAWMTEDQKRLFLDEKELDDVILLLKDYDRSFFLAFHSVGYYSFKFVVRKLVEKILKFDNLFVRIEHCNFVRKEDVEYLLDLLVSNGWERRVFLVLNPEFNTFSLEDLYDYNSIFYVCFASDSPVYGLDLKDSIFKHFRTKGRDFSDKLEKIRRIFQFNELLFEIFVKNKGS